MSSQFSTQAKPNNATATAPLIEAGLAARKRKDWDTAIAHFSEAQLLNKHDNVLQHHLSQCHSLRKMALPEDWDGAALM